MKIGNIYIGSWLLGLCLVLFLIVFCLPPDLAAQDNEDCMTCHEDKELTGEINGHERTVFVDIEGFQNSIHGEMECITCHVDLDGVDDFPHEDDLEKVTCGDCHDEIAEQYDRSLHGQVAHSGGPLAPTCSSCHGNHYILPPDDPNSSVTKFNIPFMCGRCHKEGTEVTRTYDIPQDSILSHYSQSIHGIGLFKQGLTVTAVCNDCHTSHSVLAHADPKSSIHRNNVAETCRQCHGRIEEVHRKIIKGELWEKEPNKIPVCVDCHAPHEIRRVLYEEGISDEDCLECHGQSDLTIERGGQTISLYVDINETHNSIHKKISCAQCHTDVNPNTKRQCRTVVSKVDCSICHSGVAETFVNSMHGRLGDRGDQRVPDCVSCHGTHKIKSHIDPQSQTYPTNIPELCGQCHGKDGIANDKHPADGTDPVSSYLEGIHGIGLIQSGLVVTAKCTDCHTTHNILPKDDPNSSVHIDNITAMCSNCHEGIFEEFSQSVHCANLNDTDLPLPKCIDCHLSHTISRTDKAGFRNIIMDQCGKCHEDVTESYFETFHGKVSKLGFEAAAKCNDCHGAHMILPVDNPHSTLSRQNIVGTCGECHESSHRRFAGYLTHATHHDKDKYPILYYTFWFMTILLVSTFGFFGLHTLLWLPKSFQTMRKNKKLRHEVKSKYQFRRFKPLHRRLHFMVIISFLGLAITGMTLKFSYLGWARFISEILGGFESAGFIHRICAVITFSYFLIHIFDVIRTKFKDKASWKSTLTGPDSMLPRKKDLHDFVGTLKWFVGVGPRPQYGRWTYWEKFDYFAVFWGVAIIGLTGLMLWFPEFFTRFLPGWIINVATIIHSDEALLATGFIFTVHFFNTHFRPDKFPMDTVIFTGRISLEELKEDRPEEYKILMKSKDIKKFLVEPLPDYVIRSLKIFGATALIVGISLIILIIYAEIFGYR